MKETSLCLFHKPNSFDSKQSVTRQHHWPRIDVCQLFFSGGVAEKVVSSLSPSENGRGKRLAVRWNARHRFYSSRITCAVGSRAWCCLQHTPGHDSESLPQTISLGFRSPGIWRPGSETGMRTCRVVMRRPGFERLTNEGFVERNYEIQTLTACTAN